MKKFNTLECSEIEFLCENESIEIIPRISMKEIDLISGTIGPLNVNIPCTVPLWFAIRLRKRGECVIQQPKWLTQEYLVDMLKKEKSQEQFQELPFRYIEMGLLLLNVASKDFQKAREVKTLLEDIMSIRELKVKNSLPKTTTSAMDTTGMSLMEQNKNRLFLTGALSMLYKLKEK